MPMYQGGNKVSAAYANSGEEQCPAVVNGIEVYSCGPDEDAEAIYVMDMTGGSQVLIWPHVNGFNYDCVIDWNDGTFTTIGPGDAWNSPKLTHDYSTTTGPGIYEIGVTGLSERLHFWSSGFDTLIDVLKWGKNGLTNCFQMFAFCDRCVFTAGPVSDTSLVTTMEDMFYECTIGTPDTSGFAMQNVTTIRRMYGNAAQANPDMSAWVTSSLTNMIAFMINATSMNGTGMRLWDTSNLTQAGSFAFNATVFNEDVDTWNVEKLNDAWDAIDSTAFSNGQYDALLISWAAQNVKQDVDLGVTASYSESAAAARLFLRNNKSWFIADNGPV